MGDVEEFHPPRKFRMTSSEPTSVFTDDSGSRRRRVVWAFRAGAAALVAAVAVVLTSAVGHVTLPGLDAPLHLPGSAPKNPTASLSDQTSPEPTVPTSSSATGDPSSPVGTGDAGRPGDATTKGQAATATPIRASPTAPTVAAPEPGGPTTATTKPRGKPTAKPTTAANPEHSPGNPPTEPPGRAKKDDTSS